MTRITQRLMRSWPLCLVFVVACTANYRHPGSDGDPDHGDDEQNGYAWFLQARQGPGHVMPPSARARAIDTASTLPVYPASWSPVTARGLQCASGHCSQRINGLAVDPTTPSTVYAATVYGGVAKSTDSGATWSYISDGTTSLAMGSIAIDPVNPSILYAGTMDGYWYNDSPYKVGVYRSTDGGTTWSVVGNLAGMQVTALVIDPHTAGSTTATTLYAVIDGGNPTGLWKSTDSGQSWSVVQSISDLYGALDVALDTTTSPSTVYFGASTGLLRSSDGGATWTTIHANAGYAAVSGSTLYFMDDESGGSLFRSTDRGVTWSLRTSSTVLGSDAKYLAVDPNNANNIYVGKNPVSVSKDGGATFSDYTNVDCVSGDQIHVDPHSFAFAPSNSSIMYAGNDGGVYGTVNGGGCWSDLNTNLPGSMIYGVSVSNDGHMVAGTQDNGNISYAGSGDWTMFYGGDGGFDKISPTTNTMYWGDYVSSTVAAGLEFRSDVNGANAVDITPSTAIGETSRFFPALYMNPSSGSELMMGFENVHRSTDSGASWTKLGSFQPATGSKRTVYAFCQSANDTNTIYVGTYPNNEVFVTHNADSGSGTTWTQLTSGLPTGQPPTACAVDPTNSLIAYMTYGGYGGGSWSHLYKTTDGANWSAIPGLPDAAFGDVAIDPATPQNLFVATDVGVLASGDGGSSWSIASTGIPLDVPATSLWLNGQTRKLTVGTYGRGAYTMTLPSSKTVINGGFETGSLVPWTASGSTSIVTTAHTGSYAAVAGKVGAATNGDSSIAQAFTAPSTGGTLSFWYRVICKDTVSYDWATATLADTTAGTTSTILAKTCSNSGAWTQVSSALVGGHNYELTLINHDDNYAGDPTYTLYDDVTVTATTPPPPQALTNGGFETGSVSPWTSSGSTSIATTAHSGSYAALAGVAGSPTNGDSSLAQTFTAPSTGGTLSFWYRVICKDTVSYDWATATLKDNSAGTTTRPLAKTCANTGTWTQVSTALMASHSYTLTLTNHDDNYAGDETYTYFDDVTVQ